MVEFKTTKGQLMEHCAARLCLLRDRRPLLVQIREYKSPRSTGPDSQNNHLHGHLRQLGAYMDRNVNYVKMLVMNYAMIELDYPEDQTCGIPMPKPDDEASSDEFALLIEAAHEVADMVLPGGRGALKEESE